MSQPNYAPQRISNPSPTSANDACGMPAPVLSEEDAKWFAQAQADGVCDTEEEYLAMKEEVRLLREAPETLPPGKSTAELLEMLNSLP